MRSQPSILHLDLDAFFAAVEQRDKPSLRGKPVVVGGIGQRGVVATASYEARVFGVRSAMPAHEARRRCPHAAFLAGRFGAYRAASEQVMGILRDAVAAGGAAVAGRGVRGSARRPRRPVELTDAGLRLLVADLKADVAAATGGLRASVGVGSSKFIAKVATELAKPDGWYVVEPGPRSRCSPRCRSAIIPGRRPGDGRRSCTGSASARSPTCSGSSATSWSRSSAGRTPRPCSSSPTPATTGRSSPNGRPSRSRSRTPSRSTWSIRTTLRKIIERDARQVSARLQAARSVRPHGHAEDQAARLQHPHPLPHHRRSRPIGPS